MNDIKNGQRLLSLDALRGFDMLFIMGGSALFQALSTLFPNVFFEALGNQMSHAGWNDFVRWEDMIFPLFLFIAGISFPYSLAKQRMNGLSNRLIYKKIIRRGITLVFLGMLYNKFLIELDFSSQRYLSVLARIGLAWMFAALIYIKTNYRSRVIIISTILIFYWLFLAFVPVPGLEGLDPLSKAGNWVGYIDRILVPGRLLNETFDPEGLLSTIPAIATALLGMLTGDWVKNQTFVLSENKKVIYLLFVGVFLILLGLVWHLVFPINKRLWSSSFVCYAGGIAVCLFAIFYYIIDVKKSRKWTFFFRVIGMNSITIYLGQRIINFDQVTNFFLGGIISKLPEISQPLFFSIGYISFCWIFLYILYRKNIFLKV